MQGRGGGGSAWSLTLKHLLAMMQIDLRLHSPWQRAPDTRSCDRGPKGGHSNALRHCLGEAGMLTQLEASLGG